MVISDYEKKEEKHSIFSHLLFLNEIGSSLRKYNNNWFIFLLAFPYKKAISLFSIWMEQKRKNFRFHYEYNMIIIHFIQYVISKLMCYSYL